MVRIIHASADRLPLPDASVHAVITSPPYWAMRTYAGEQTVAWPEVRFRFNEWVEETVIPPMTAALGMEESLPAYVGHLIHCLREGRRCLHASGTVWLNLGDGYSAKSTHAGRDKAGSHGHGEASAKAVRGRLRGMRDGLKEKDLAAVPWLVAMAARADGWYLRVGVVWAKSVSFADVKGFAMPESVIDRPALSHEYIFLLAKQKRYFFDKNAVREPASESSLKRVAQKTFWQQTGGDKDYGAGVNANRSARKAVENFAKNPGKGVRSVWAIAQPMYCLRDDLTSEQRAYVLQRIAGGDEIPADLMEFSEPVELTDTWAIPPKPNRAAHFAMWPPALVEPMVKMSTSAGGACQSCLTPYRAAGDGWAADCTCAAGTTPCVVLDPFCGGGTTLKVAHALGRAAVGVDISQPYLDTVVPQILGRRYAVEQALFLPIDIPVGIEDD